MIRGRVARHSLTVRRAPEISDGRRTTRDWANATSTTLPGWAIDAGDTTPDNEQREGGSIAYTARGPMDADVKGTDRVELFGETFTIDGAPTAQPGPTARTSHLIIKLVRWVG